ncbi:MAG: hypothetical protein WCD49_18335 [Candidatus Acidiferrales bacterium]
MQLFQDVLIDPSESKTIRSDFFARPPLRSLYFILGTLFALLALALVAGIAERNWNHLSTTSIIYMALATTMMLFVWLGAYYVFERLHELYSEAKLETTFAGSPTEKVFRLAGGLMGNILYYGFGAMFWFLLAFGVALNHR